MLDSDPINDQFEIARQSSTPESEPDWNRLYDDSSVDYDRPLGKCANCSDIIYWGEGYPPVHSACEQSYIGYLMGREVYRDDD